MTDKKKEEVEVKTEAKTEVKTETKKDVEKLHISNRLEAINKIQDRAKAKRAAARLFRKGN